MTLRASTASHRDSFTFTFLHASVFPNVCHMIFPFFLDYIILIIFGKNHKLFPGGKAAGAWSGPLNFC
jgi:hypothetical protein